MKNLKRALSFALASVMLIGMMVVGSSAAVLKDIDDVEHIEAVNSMVALGLINGRGGNYEPEAEITRAEMAKLICVALNGGRDPKLDGECQFTDMKGHWAAGYVQYCVNLGIVSGRSSTIFDPQSAVTAQEAAKMLLVAIGYNADNEGFKGNGWGGRVDVVANQKGLYDDVMLLTTSKLNRDDAAQIVWNAMDARMVEYDWYPVTVNGATEFRAIAKDKAAATQTILGQKFDLKSEYGYMTGVTYDSKKNEFTYSFTTSVNAATVERPAITTQPLSLATSFKTDKDYSDLFGMKVKVMYKNDTARTLFGMFGEKDQVLFEGTIGDVKDSSLNGDAKVEIDGTKYEVNEAADNDLVVRYFLDGTGATDMATAKNYTDEWTMKVLDIDGDGKANLAVITPFTAGKVTFVGKETVTAATISLDVDDDVLYDGIKKDDYVKIVEDQYNAKGQNVVTKLEKVSGKVTATRKDDSDHTIQMRIDGVWYDIASTLTAGNNYDAKPGEEWDLYVDGTVYFHTEKTSTEATLDDVLFVEKHDSAVTMSGLSTKVWFMDGTSAVVNVSKIGGAEITTVSNGTEKVGLYTFKVKDGKYELTVVSGSNKAGFDAYVTETAKFDDDKGYVDGSDALYLADDAVVVVHSTNAGEDNKVVFYTGKQAKDWDWDNMTITAGKYLADAVKGLSTAKAGVITVSSAQPEVAGDEGYGYILTKPQRIKEDGDYYWQYDLWTADGKVTVKDKEASANDLDVGQKDVIRYKDLGDGIIEASVKIAEISDTGVQPGAAVAITGIGSSTLAATVDGDMSAVVTYKLTKDTVYLYVNTKDKAGVEGGEIELADKIENDTKLNLNAWLLAKTPSDGDDAKVLLVVYDVNNKIDGSTAVTITNP